MTAGLTLLDRVDAIVDSDVLESRHKLVLIVLARHDGQAGIYPSIATIARKSGMSTATVKRALRELESMGWLKRSQRHEEGSSEHASTLYSLTVQVGSPRANIGRLTTSQPRLTTNQQVGSPRARGWLTTSHKHASLNGYMEEDLPARSRAGGKSAVDGSGPESDHRRVTEAYFAAFEGARGARPPFDGKDGRAVKALIKKLGADRAIEVIRRAFAPESFFRSSATIQSIANDPARFVGAAGPATARTRPGAPLIQSSEGRSWVLPEEAK